MAESHSTINWLTCEKCNLKYKHLSSLNRHKPKCEKFQKLLKCGKSRYPFQRYYNQYAKVYDSQKNNEASCSNEGQMVTSLSENHNQKNEENNIPNKTKKLDFVQNLHFIPKVSTCKIDTSGRHQEHERNAETKPFICNLCGLRQTSRMALFKHAKQHNIKKRHICKHSTCSMQFYHILLLKDHLCVEHPELKQFVCSFCSRWFQMKRNLRKHIELFHMQ